MATNPQEYLRGPLFEGMPHIKYLPRSGQVNQFAGRTVLNSGSATVTVSTALVGANDIIIVSGQRATAANSGQSASVVVRSISAGNFFTLGRADGAAQPGDETCMWILFKAD